jgi:GNAT superfamily N-acetyltransferase
MKLEFDVPNDFDVQFYYVQSRTELLPVAWPQGFRFVMLSKPSDAVAIARMLLRRFKFVQTAKTFAKLITPNRRFYVIADSSEIVSWGWCTVGKNNFYRVESTAMSIGPIETVESARGKGLASQGLKAAINFHIELGSQRFYIDTHQNNIAAQKSFAHAGFGSSCGFYRR